MQRSLSSWFIALCAAPLMLVSSAAMASGPAAADCNLLNPGSCSFVTTPATCMGQCTPPSFVAECDGECDVSASATCTASCSANCMTMCTANPGSFSCTGQCTSDCEGTCAADCNGQDSGCASDCMLDCQNRCGIQCQATPPSASCQAECQASCNGSCQVQANIDCHANCTASVAPGNCEIDCKGPTGAVFCGNPPQYINFAKAQAAAANCLAYLESQGISASGTCVIGTGCTGTIAGIPVKSGCSASPGLGAEDRWGALGIAGLMMGVGLVVSRRKRRG